MFKQAAFGRPFYLSQRDEIPLRSQANQWKRYTVQEHSTLFPSGVSHAQATFGHSHCTLSSFGSGDRRRAGKHAIELETESSSVRRERRGEIGRASCRERV